MNFTQALGVIVNATVASVTRCERCGGHDGHDMGDMEGMEGMEGMNHEMKMWFHVGQKETVLFEEWSFDSVGGLVGSAVGIFFLAVLYEAWKFGRELLALRMKQGCQGTTTNATMWSMPHFVQTLMHAVQYILSYFLMFIFMTYNVWLCLAIVLGGAVGYFLFGWKKTSLPDVNEHCH